MTPESKPQYPDWLPRRMLYVARSSRAIRGGEGGDQHSGVFAAPAEHLLGLLGREVAYEVPGHGAGVCAVEACTFFSNAAGGHFYSLEMLFAPDGDRLLVHPAFHPALAHRDLFLSKDVAVGALRLATSALGGRGSLRGEAAHQLLVVRDLLRGKGFLARHPEAAVVAALAEKSRRPRGALAEHTIGALRRDVERALKTSDLRAMPDRGQLDQVCFAVLNATLGHRVQLPVMGEWRSDTWGFDTGLVYTKDLGVV